MIRETDPYDFPMMVKPLDNQCFVTGLFSAIELYNGNSAFSEFIIL